MGRMDSHLTNWMEQNLFLWELEKGKIYDLNPVICCPCGQADLGYINGNCEKAELAGKSIINGPCIIS